MSRDCECFAETYESGIWHLAGPYGETQIEYLGRPSGEFERWVTPVEIPHHQDLYDLLLGYGIGSFEAPPLFGRRRLPEDISREGLLYLKEKRSILTGVNWVFLSELLRVNWDSLAVPRFGYVHREHASLFHAERPFPSRFKDRVNGNSAPGYRKVEWIETYRDAISDTSTSNGAASEPDFFNDTLPHLLKYGLPDRVRLIVYTY